MRDYLSIGSTPFDEPCFQVGHCSTVQQRAECGIFLQQIERHYPTPEDCRLSVKSNPHDFGTYYEVNVVYDYDDQDQIDWALSVEGDTKGKLDKWDKEAQVEIKAYIDSGSFPLDYGQ